MEFRRERGGLGLDTPVTGISILIDHRHGKHMVQHTRYNSASRTKPRVATQARPRHGIRYLICRLSESGWGELESVLPPKLQKRPISLGASFGR